MFLCINIYTTGGPNMWNRFLKMIDPKHWADKIAADDNAESHYNIVNYLQIPSTL